MSTMLTSHTLKRLRQSQPSISLTHLELAELVDFVFLLADLWHLDQDAIRFHWLANLFAAGREAHGNKVSRHIVVS